MELPIDRFLNMIYYWLVGDGDPKEVEKLNTRLNTPPAGYRKSLNNSPWSPEAETNALSDLAGAVGAYR